MENFDFLEKGFYKVAQTGGNYVVATFYNPDTKEEISKCVRDYDYSDCSRDNDELYFMPIDENVKIEWLHGKGVILIGDKIKVVKGRKVPIGTISEVIDKRDFKDRYGRVQGTYLYLENGMKTNENNCELILLD